MVRLYKGPSRTVVTAIVFFLLLQCISTVRSDGTASATVEEVMDEDAQKDYGGSTGVGAGPLPEQARGVRQGEESVLNNLLQTGPCTMLSNLQDAVLQVMTAHYEYGHGIHRLHGHVEQLQQDLADLKAQLVDVERRQTLEELGVVTEKQENKGQTTVKVVGEVGDTKEKDKTRAGKSSEGHQNKGHLNVKGGRAHHKGESSTSTYRHRHEHRLTKAEDSITDELDKLVQSSKNMVDSDKDTALGGAAHSIVPTSELLTPREKTLVAVPPYRKDFIDTLASYMAGYFNSSLYRETYPSFSLLVHNVTELLNYHGGRLAALQRRLHGVRKQVRHAVGQMSDWEKTLKLYDSRSISHMLEKQREINTALERRVSTLEESVKLQGVMLHRDQAKAQVSTPDGECPAGFVRHMSSCYLFGNMTAHWIDAEKHCQSRHHQAHLVAIETASEHDFIVTYRQYNAAHWTSYYVWTGGTNILEGGGDSWRWVSTHRPMSYTKWRKGKPAARGRGEQHCVYFPTVGGDSKWDDWHCYAARLNFVCEIQL